MHAFSFNSHSNNKVLTVDGSEPVLPTSSGDGEPYKTHVKNGYYMPHFMSDFS